MRWLKGCPRVLRDTLDRLKGLQKDLLDAIKKEKDKLKYDVMDLQFRLKRIALRDTYTIGHLYVYENGDWKFLCDTLEDKVRDLNKNGRFDNGEKKVYGETAIPYGKYEIDMNTISPKFRTRAWGLKYNGIVPRFKGVDSFDGVLIHPLNKASESLGCVGPGKNDKVGWVSNSTNTYYKIMDLYLMPAREKGMKIFIEVI